MSQDHSNRKPGWRRHWIPALLYTLGIFLLSSIHGSFFKGIQVPLDAKFIPFSMQENPDKYVHFSLYFIFAWFWSRVFLHLPRLSTPQALLATWALTGLYGASDEWHQYFVPDRYCDLNDWLADILGGLALILILAACRYFHRSKIPTHG